MSWTMWHEEGLGFLTSGLNEETVYEFMRNHKSSLDKRDAEWLLEKTLNEDFGKIDDEIKYLTDNGTYAEIIADIISKETGVRFDSVGVSDDGEECVMYYPGFPWSFNKKEMAFKSSGDVGLVLAPYMKELDIGRDKFGWQDLVFSG